jgi:hypothetical protein
MANIKVQNLANSIATEVNLGSFIRKLSESELTLQGGKKRNSTPTPIVISDTPFIPPDIQTLDLSNILLGFAPYSIF